MGSPKNRKEESWVWLFAGFLVTASLGVIWSSFLSSSFAERDRTLTLQTERTQNTAIAFASNLGSLLGDSRLSLTILAGLVEGNPNTDPWHMPEFRSTVLAIRDHSQEGLDVRMVDSDGSQRILGPQFDRAPIFVGDREYFLRHTAHHGSGFFVGKPVFDSATAAWSLDVSMPLPPNRRDAVLVTSSLGFLRLDTLAASLVSEADETVSIYRDDGALLYRRPLPKDFPTDPNPSLYPALLKTRTASGTLPVDSLAAYRRVSKVPLWVVVERPSSSLLAPWQARFQIELVWLGLLTVVLLASTAGLLFFLRRLKELRLAQEALARTDPLTGLLNRRAFLERCDQEQLRNSRHPGSLSLVVLDLDHFKRVNDQFGHPAGDRALKDFSEALLRTLRATDVMARIGGEEFAVLMLETGEERAKEIGERVRVEVAKIALPEGNLTTSIGLAVWDGAETFEAWFARADRALYRAKEGGRNRIEAAS